MKGIDEEKAAWAVSKPGSGAETDQDVGPPPLVQLNRPFRGGYIIACHGRSERSGSRGSGSSGFGSGKEEEAPGRLPWIQVEFNRALYLGTPPVTAQPDPEAALRLAELRRRFLRALETLFREYSFPPE